MENFAGTLPQNLQNIVAKGDIQTAEDVIATPSSRLLLLQGCTEHDVKLLKEAAAKLVGPSAVSASDLLSPPWSLKWSRISFGCTALDRCTRGGIVTRGITEICGASGVGKTQLLLQLSLNVQLPTHLGGLGVGKAVAFICTEDVFPSKRLFQMSKGFAQRYPEQTNNFLGNVYVDHILQDNNILTCVCDRLNKLMETTNIGLIIIDSVAAIFRLYTNFIERARDMRKMANALLNYADKYHCAVICVNQVTNVSANETDVPCLGLAWAHLGRTRIKISKVPKQVMFDQQLQTIRKLEIMYSPDTPNEFAEFLITEGGIIDVP